MQFKVIEQHNQAVFDSLVAGVRQFNDSKLGNERSEPLMVALYDDNQELIAGVAGRTIYRNFLIEVLWVAEHHRDKGLGKQVMLRAEKLAIERGCVLAQVDTLSVQAPEFYQKLGFDIVGRVPAFTGSPERLFLTKQYQALD
ncbi:GNAT family N-acetyltransferase [Shewanella maritima]|uniref:GNAT family N-acetyltransferase n=1 Tax=Shewanella maritima TaxID=2520507 RepID=UPI003734E85F